MDTPTTWSNIPILLYFKFCSHCSSNCFILKFPEEQVMFTKSVRTLDFSCSVWFTMSMWSKSVQSGSTRFSLPTFVFTSKEVNYFFLWTRFCELKLSETSELRLKKWSQDWRNRSMWSIQITKDDCLSSVLNVVPNHSSIGLFKLT